MQLSFPAILLPALRGLIKDSNPGDTYSLGGAGLAQSLIWPGSGRRVSPNLIVTPTYYRRKRSTS